MRLKAAAKAAKAAKPHYVHNEQSGPYDDTGEGVHLPSDRQQPTPAPFVDKIKGRLKNIKKDLGDSWRGKLNELGDTFKKYIKDWKPPDDPDDGDPDPDDSGPGPDSPEDESGERWEAGGWSIAPEILRLSAGVAGVAFATEGRGI